MSGVIPSFIALGIVALIATWLTMSRYSPPGLSSERSAASVALAGATALQGVHFAEELATGFDIEFPALFGLDPMSRSIFVVSNLTLLTFWIASIPLLHSVRKAAFFAAWFLAIAGMLNGLAHPLMSVMSRGYFPGLVSSPFIGLAGVVLWRKLSCATLSQGNK